MFKAAWVALTTPRPDHRVSTIPTARTRPFPSSAWTFREIWVPMTGKLANAESTMRCWRSGSLRRTMPRMVTNTSNRGNSEKNP